jgi:hypothetical protein
MSTLDEEIGHHRSEIRTTQWSVSIGEIFSLYERGQLEINPAFQRFFRWSDTQKTYLVESILLGLPIPPLFFAQAETGVLEVVDGVQRLSTLLQLRGILRAPADGGANEIRAREPLVMEPGQYLEHLDGLVWDDEQLGRSITNDIGRDAVGALTEAQRSDIQFAKLDATIIQRTSAGQAKYDVFRRLNSYGEPLTPQEMRAALIASTDSEALSWLTDLARSGDTPKLLSLSDRQMDRQYDVELVLRFFFLVEADELRAAELRDFSALLDDYGIELAEQYPSERTQSLGDAFTRTLKLITAAGGSDFFRRFYPDEDRFKGPFLNTSFEALASSVGYWLIRGEPVADDLMAKARDFWRREELEARFATGRSTEWRIASYVPIGRELMRNVEGSAR